MEHQVFSDEETKRLLEESERVIEHAKEFIAKMDRSLWRMDRIMMALLVVDTAFFAFRLASNGNPLELLAGPFDPISSRVLGLCLLAEGLAILAFVLTPWFTARRAREEIADPVAKMYWPPGTAESVKAMMRDFYSKEDPSDRALETFQNAYRKLGTIRSYLGMALSGVAFYYFEHLRGPWAALNFLMVQALLLWSFPTRTGMKRWTRRRVAAYLDIALPPDFME